MKEEIKSTATQDLHSLYEKLKTAGGHEIPSKLGCAEEELEIFKEHYELNLPEKLINFLSETLPNDELDIGVYRTYSPKELLEYQLDAVPFYGTMKYNLFGLGSWTGESDGDGWMYDLESGKIYAIPLHSNYEESKEDVLNTAYQ